MNGFAFIELTPLGRTYKVWVSVSHIRYFRPSEDRGGGSFVSMELGEGFHVTESKEEIVGKLKAAGIAHC